MLKAIFCIFWAVWATIVAFVVLIAINVLRTFDGNIAVRTLGGVAIIVVALVAIKLVLWPLEWGQRQNPRRRS